MNSCNESYTRLANAIILQAVRDYREALKKLSRKGKNEDALSIKNNVLRFFRSDWFTALTSIDPEMLISKLDAEVE